MKDITKKLEILIIVIIIIINIIIKQLSGNFELLNAEVHKYT